MSTRIRKGDVVQVLAGKNKGARGSVLGVSAKSGRVTVENVNIVKRHQKARGQGQQSGIIESPRPIHVSNVALVHKDEATRVGFKVVKGKKIRWSRKHDEAIDAE